MADKGDVRLRAIAQRALSVETGGDVTEAVQAALMAGVEPYEIAELSGLPMRRVLEVLGGGGADWAGALRGVPSRASRA